MSSLTIILFSSLATFHLIVLASVDHSCLNQLFHWGLQTGYFSSDNYVTISSRVKKVFPFFSLSLSLFFPINSIQRVAISYTHFFWWSNCFEFSQWKPSNFWKLLTQSHSSLSIPFWNNSMSGLTLQFSFLRHGLSNFPQRALHWRMLFCYCFQSIIWSY